MAEFAVVGHRAHNQIETSRHSNHDPSLWSLEQTRNSICEEPQPVVDVIGR